MTWEKLYDQYLRIEAKKAKSSVNEWDKLVEEAKTDKNVFILKQTKDYIVFRPLNFKASNHYGMYCLVNSWCIVKDQEYWKRYTKEDHNTFYFILCKEIPENKRRSPWFKTCIQVNKRQTITAWNFFDESTTLVNEILRELKIDMTENDFRGEISIKYLSKDKQEILLAENGALIKYLDDYSDELAKIAIDSDQGSFIYIARKQGKHLSTHLKHYAVKLHPELIEYIEDPTEELQEIAVKAGSWLIYKIKNPSQRIKEIARKNL